MSQDLNGWCIYIGEIGDHNHDAPRKVYKVHEPAVLQDATLHVVDTYTFTSVWSTKTTGAAVTTKQPAQPIPTSITFITIIMIIQRTTLSNMQLRQC